MQQDGDQSLRDWMTAVGDTGSRAERVDWPSPALTSGGHEVTGPGWTQALEDSLSQLRQAPDARRDRPAGATIAASLRRVFGIVDP